MDIEQDPAIGPLGNCPPEFTVGHFARLGAEIVDPGFKGEGQAEAVLQELDSVGDHHDTGANADWWHQKANVAALAGIANRGEASVIAPPRWFDKRESRFQCGELRRIERARIGEGATDAVDHHRFA
jgi:hypothetical protein